MDILGTLKSKIYGIPVWLITFFVIAGGALYLRHRKATAVASTATAANQSNSNLGTAGQLANMFTTAGIMPYQGGNTYVNSSGPTDQPVTVNVGHNQSLQAIVDWAKKNGYPNFTWADLWALNPQLVYSGKAGVGNLQKDTKGNWILTSWSTPVTIYKPGTLQTGAGGISGDNPNPPTFAK